MTRRIETLGILAACLSMLLDARVEGAVESGKVRHIMVAQEVETAKAPEIEDKVLDISAAYYWSLQAQGRLRKVWEEGEHIRLKTLSVRDYRDSGEMRVLKQALEDREAKLKGFQNALFQFVSNGIAIPHFPESALTVFRERLRRLTNLHFQTRDEWIDWYKNNKDYLALSADATHLVVRE